MTDDEKMLLVAKACGWTLRRTHYPTTGETFYFCRELGRRIHPRTDCNDMAEIVAKLGLQIHANNMLGVAECSTKGVLFNDLKASRIPADGNIKAALCRAVFEVAAKIGETL